MKSLPSLILASFGIGVVVSLVAWCVEYPPIIGFVPSDSIYAVRIP